jgi:hypothetical protein
MNADHHIHGLVAEFDSAEAGYRNLDAYAPFAIDDLSDALELPASPIPYIMFGGALAGCGTGLWMQFYANLHSYPMNIGGRPLNSWPAFIPPTVELTILFAVVSGLIALFFSLHLPAIYHPVFNHPDFRRASRDGFFLCIECVDGQFDAVGTSAFLQTLSAISVQPVEI